MFTEYLRILHKYILQSFPIVKIVKLLTWNHLTPNLGVSTMTFSCVFNALCCIFTFTFSLDFEGKSSHEEIMYAKYSVGEVTESETILSGNTVGFLILTKCEMPKRLHSTL